MVIRTMMAVAAAVAVAGMVPLPAAARAKVFPEMLNARGAVDPGIIAGEVLARHNDARRRAGVAPLAWDPALAAGARAYAADLARLNAMRHSPKALRPGQGENLWMGTRDYFRPSAMVDAWASERSMFRPARFPDVSTTGNWADVGHYTQMIWPRTTRVGCAIGKSAWSDILVCRYWPSGNVTGQSVP